MVLCGRKHNRILGSPRLNNKLTKGDAVGPSRVANSSPVNGSFGMIIARRGMSNEMTIGNPIAADDVAVSGHVWHREASRMYQLSG